MLGAWLLAHSSNRIELPPVPPQPEQASHPALSHPPFFMSEFRLNRILIFIITIIVVIVILFLMGDG